MSIVQQQIELHFGDEYPTVESQAKRFVSTVYRRYNGWSKGGGEELLRGEGGMEGAMLGALATIIEVGDVREGLERWAKRMSQQYTNNHERTFAGLNDATDIPSLVVEEGGEHPLGDAPATPLPGLHPLRVGGEIRRRASGGLTVDEMIAEETDFCETLISTHSLTETAEFMGIPYERAKSIKARIKYRLTS